MPIHGTCKLHVIDGQSIVSIKTATGTQRYLLTDLCPDKRVADPAWRLTKADGTFHDVHVDRHGPACTCGDFVNRREHRDPKGCKHVAALRVLRFIP